MIHDRNWYLLAHLPSLCRDKLNLPVQLSSRFLIVGPVSADVSPRPDYWAQIKTDIIGEVQGTCLEAS